MRKKLLKEEKEIESFIKWLQKFYTSPIYQRVKVLDKIKKKDYFLFNWLNGIIDIDEDNQKRLYESLRGTLND